MKPGVVIGQVRDGKYPVLGDDVMLGANCCIIGDITVGNHVSVGAGAVVVSDLPDHCTAVGNPARVIRKES